MALTRRAGSLLAAAAALVLVAGCGSPELWARWRAEAAWWRVHARDARLRGAGPLSTGQVTRLRDDYRRVAAAWPPARWLPRAAAGDTLARDVARVSARAETRAATLDAALGHTAAATLALERLATTDAGLWPAAFEAQLARAGVLEAAGDSAHALDAWQAAARAGVVVDPDSARVCNRTFVAAHRVGDAHRRDGRDRAADSLWDGMSAAIEAALRVHTGDSLAPALWLRLGETRMARGGPEALAGARFALGHALTERTGGPFAFDAMLGIGEAMLAMGRADSAVVWARRAGEISPLPERDRSSHLEARAFESAGQLDSAAAALDRLAETRHLPLGVATLARYQEGLLLERLGRWELARSAYHSVIASDPLSPSAFDAIERQVLHHVQQHEPELIDQQARNGLDLIDRTLGTVRDPQVRLRALQTRARLFTWMGDEPSAMAAWEEAWRAAPTDPDGIVAGFTAAEMAVHLNDGVRAVNLYRELARVAPRPATRDSAARAAARIPGGPH